LSGLESIARSRTEPVAGSSARGAAGLTGKTHLSMRWGKPWACIIRRSNGYIERAKAEGALAALDERARRARADDHRRGQDVGGGVGLPEGEGVGYPHEVWTTRLLARLPASMTG